MKTRYVSVAALIACLSCMAADITAPSDFLGKAHPRASMLDVLYQQGDLRLLFCDKEILDDRRKRGVCRVDSDLNAPWRREFPVSTNTTVRDILLAMGKPKWSGEPQVRIIKRDAILQTEFPKRSDAWQNFTSTRVEPGDFVIFTKRIG